MTTAVDAAPGGFFSGKGFPGGKESRFSFCCLFLLGEVFGEEKVRSQSASEPCQSLLLSQAVRVVGAQV